jgi:ubiquinol-cytochrome c reductase cytochrome b subunit
MLHKVLVGIFAVSFVVLGWLGAQSGSDLQKLVAQILTFYYFAFFITMPLWSAMGETKPVPERVTTHD